jgi:flagellar basal body P-ring formation protein FlgA
MLFQSKLHKRTFILLIAAICSASAHAAVLELLPEAQVDVQGIFLGEIIKPTKDVSGTLQISAPPAWGETRKLTRVQLSEMLAKSLPSTQVEWTGASEIRITRKSRMLQDRELMQLLTKQLQPTDSAKGGELILALSREWKPVPVPVEPIEIKILEKPNISPAVLLKFQIVSVDESVGTFTVFLKSQLMREVWVARENLRRGATVSPASFVKERRDIINIREPVWSTEELDPSLQLAQGVQTGSVLFSRCVQTKPVIRRGSFIQAVASEAGLSLSMRVQALEDGAPDQVIRIQNPRTRKILQGKVINEQTIEPIF